MAIQPAPATLAVIQDKLRQKQHLSTAGVPVAAFAPVGWRIAGGRRRGGGGARLSARAQGPARRLRRPRQRARRRPRRHHGGAGSARRPRPLRRGRRPVRARAGGDGRPHDRRRGRRLSGRRDGPYPAHLRRYDRACARSRSAAAARAVAVASRAIASLGGAGVFGVELFQTADDRIWLNEIAPRPHNSGHYTIEGCQTSQFEQHLRAIIGRPLGPTELTAPCVVMINILGENPTPRPAAPVRRRGRPGARRPRPPLRQARDALRPQDGPHHRPRRHGRGDPGAGAGGAGGHHDLTLRASYIWYTACEGGAHDDERGDPGPA